MPHPGNDQGQIGWGLEWKVSLPVAGGWKQDGL